MIGIPQGTYTLRGEISQALTRVTLLDVMIKLEIDLQGHHNAPTVVWLRRHLYTARRDWIRLMKAARQRGEL